MEPIGEIRTDFIEKFGTPRQGLMIPSAIGVIRFFDPVQMIPACLHLEKFSHIWLIYQFHKNISKGWKPTIRPPRLGVFRKIGVLASRSPHRPNGLGMSAVKLEKIVKKKNPPDISIHISGVDILDGTPILDIKPYLPYSDAIIGANAGWAEGEISRFSVRFSALAESSLQKDPDAERLRDLIVQVLEWDPRPTSQRRAFPIGSPKSEGKKFGFNLRDFDIQWRIAEGDIVVEELLPRRSSPTKRG